MWKIGAGILGAGSVVTGGVFLYKELSKPNTYSIKDLLSSKNPEKRLMSKSSTGSEDHGKKSGKAYLDSKKNIWNLTNGKESVPSVDESAPEEFMSKCDSLSKEKVIDENDDKYKNILQFCTRATLVSDLISENNPKRKILSSSGSEDNDGGRSAGSRYQSDNTGKLKGHDKGVLDEWTTHSGNEAPSGLKTRCVSKLKEEAFELDDENYTNSVEWCTN